MKHVKLTFIFSLFILCSCNELDLKGLVTSTSLPVKQRFHQSLLYNESIAEESTLDGISDGPILRTIVNNDRYVLYFGTDLHIATKTNCLRALMNQAYNDTLTAAILLGGDFIQGHGNWQLVAEELSHSKERYGEHSQEKPILTTVGNHDLFFSQWDSYLQYFRTATWYAEVIRQNATGTVTDYIITLDSASGTLGEEQLEWLKKLLAAITKNNSHNKGKIIVMTHTNIIIDSARASSPPLCESQELFGLFASNRVDLVLMGHFHTRTAAQFGGVRYVVAGALKQEGISNNATPGFCKVEVDDSHVNVLYSNVDL